MGIDDEMEFDYDKIESDDDEEKFDIVCELTPTKPFLTSPDSHEKRMAE